MLHYFLQHPMFGTQAHSSLPTNAFNTCPFSIPTLYLFTAEFLHRGKGTSIPLGSEIPTTPIHSV